MNNELYKLSNSNINMLDIIFNAREDDLAIMIKKDIEKVNKTSKQTNSAYKLFKENLDKFPNDNSYKIIKAYIIDTKSMIDKLECQKQALEEKQNSLLNLLIDGTIDKEIYNAKKLS